MVFAWVVTGEVSGCDIRDRFGVDAYKLCKIRLERLEKLLVYHTFRRRASSGDIGSGAIIVAVLRFSHHDSNKASKSFERAKRQNSRQRRKSSASSSSYIPQAANSFDRTPTVSLIALLSPFTPFFSGHRTQWHRPSPASPDTQQNDSASGPPLHAHPSPIPTPEEQSQPHYLAIMPLPPISLPSKPAPA